MIKPLIVIPTRLKATRLPGKPLADILGEPMIVHVWRRAIRARVGDVIVATDSEEIAEIVARAGAEVVMTREDHQSGSDRVFEAVNKVDPGQNADVIINLQGDLPTLEPELIGACVEPLANNSVDIATLAAEIEEPSECLDPNVVKVIGTPSGLPEVLRALYFTRASAPYGYGPFFHHIGIYAFRRQALARFVSLPPSPLEKREKLEQLRALEAGMRIDVKCVDTVPLGVDTPGDLIRARSILAAEAAKPTRRFVLG
jgi:3-deoxy-manno-octulosonate cytidylyltransferase (CMP-KDO synthetase)